MFHVEVSLGAPLGAGDVSDSGGGEHQGGIAVGEVAYDSGASADFTHDPFEHIVGPDSSPMFSREVRIRVGQVF